MSVPYRADAQIAAASQRKSLTSVPIAGLICEGEKMAEYIEKQRLLDFLDAAIEEEKGTRHQVIVEAIKMTVERIPSADVIERKRGKWQITDAYPHNVYCSECHKKFAQTHWAVWEDGSPPRNFCPNCGADMRESNNE